MKNAAMKSLVNFFGSYTATALIALLLAFPGAAFAIAGKFEFVNGQVQIIDATGAQHNVSKGDVINQGDTISASANGFAQVKMEDGGFFAVRPDTQFRIDTFNFNGKEDGSEKGVFSLIKGSLRSVTGLIGKAHRDNYKINTASSTIGIRGSGADIGNDDAIGTAVHTLFGGHTLTSHGQTIETGPGQTALAAPGQAPRFVPNFPFNTSTSPGDKSGNGSAGNSNTAKNTQADSPPGNSPDKVVVPIVTTDGINLTTNTDASGTPIGGTAAPGYIHFAAGIIYTGSGFQIVEEGSNKTTYPFSNYTFNGIGGLIGVANSSLSIYNSNEFTGSPSEILTDPASSFLVTSGTESDLYHTPDNSLYIGRSTNTVADITCGVCSGSDTFVNSVFIVGLTTPPALVQTITGSNTYTLVNSTHPTDGFGHVGTLNSASLIANFSSQTVNLNANLSINNKTLIAMQNGLPIVADGFETNSRTGGLSVTCTGSNCGSPSAYAGDIGGKFFGNSAATAGFEYLFWPTADSGDFSDIIQGAAALSASGTPTAIPSDAAFGGGASIVGLATNPSTSLFGEFSSASRLVNGNLVAFASDQNSGGSLSASLGSGSVIPDGSDPALGVIWGRWSPGFIVNEKNNNAEFNASPSGNLAFITGTHITTATELANYLSFTGSGLSGGNTIGTYTLVPGTVPTVGSAGGSITNATAVYSFSGNNFTSFSVTGSGGIGAFSGPWTVTGSGTLASFSGSSGLSLSNGPLNGSAKGGFVGNHAQGLISTVGLSDGSTYNLGAALYMKR